MAGQQPANISANFKLSFPLTHKAIDALHAFASGSLLHLHLVICDEAVVLKKDEEDCPLLGTILDLQNVATESRLLPGDDTANVGYHLFSLSHQQPMTQEVLSKAVLVFVRPPTTSPVRDRMKYAACVGELVHSIEQFISPLAIAKRLEVDHCDELTIGFVASALYPDMAMPNEGANKVQCINADGRNGSSFTKPAPPPGASRRGGRRLIR